MKTTHKYSFDVKGQTNTYRVSMPVGALVLHVGTQNMPPPGIVQAEVLPLGDGPRRIFVWALVDTDMPMQEREFVTYMTGEVIPEDVTEGENTFEHRATIVNVWRTGLVIHVFERMRR